MNKNLHMICSFRLINLPFFGLWFSPSDIEYYLSQYLGIQELQIFVCRQLGVDHVDILLKSVCVFLQLDKFNTFRGKEKKDRPRADGKAYRPPTIDEHGGDINDIFSKLNKLSEDEINKKFDEMLVSEFMHNFVL